MTTMTTRNHQAPDTSLNHPVSFPTHPEASAANTTGIHRTLPTPEWRQPVEGADGDRSEM